MVETKQVEQRTEKTWALYELDREIGEAQAAIAKVDTDLAAQIAKMQADAAARKSALQTKLDGYIATRAIVEKEAAKVALAEAPKEETKELME